MLRRFSAEEVRLDTAHVRPPSAEALARVSMLIASGRSADHLSGANPRKLIGSIPN